MSGVERETQIQILALDERLANPGPNESGDSLAAIFAAEFREFGSSARIFDAETLLRALDRVTHRLSRGPIGPEGFRTERAAPNVILGTHLARAPAGAGWKPPTLRSSRWVKRDRRWQIVFHQGTPTPSEASARTWWTRPSKSMHEVGRHA